jgi:autotransporter-associated beta strand protein
MEANYNINSLTFVSGAGSFVLGGANTLTIQGGGIANNDDSLQTINIANIAMGAAQMWNAASGALTVSSAINTNGHALTVSGAYNSILSGLIIGNGGLTKIGNATLAVGGASANSYSGDTNVDAGTLEYSASNALGSGALYINGSSTLSMGTYNDTVGIVTLNGGSITGSGVLTSTGTFEMKKGSVSAVLAGSGIALNKTTGDTVILSGNNTYSGATSISGGTLKINGNQSSATGAVTVASGATLGGSGTIGGTVSVSGGKLAPDGTLTAGTTTWNGGSIWEFELTTPGASDKLVINGDFLKSGSGFIFNLMNSTPVTGTYTLIDWSGTTGFLAGDFSYTGLSGAYAGSSFAINGTQLDFTVVPEPTNLLIGGLLGLGFLRRRRVA